MNTRSKSVCTPPVKPYKTHEIVTTGRNVKMANINPAPVTPKAASNGTVNIENMTIDQKLNMLIASVAKLETVPADIVKMQDSIKVIQTDVKDIPVLSHL